ncbi:MAG: 5'/3'-nucleotidase SurE [Bacteroidota bacterium]|nr:5'/3'-nucleotidase SurE [Bacteroidota bacterium]MDP4193098.1 5'/3'-nucleotidase SurE [Bacteroidota bacterium]MDP4196652.1 5'/3'-nucleotidase SurE [Bacteroidota bacterium]
MRILVSNDDGIDSPGIQALVKALSEIAEVTVVAPHAEQSAAGHSITMQVPLRISKYYKDGEFFGYAINGTPADCVKIGIRNIMKSLPDIVVSGINHGSNTAINIIYSGTVSAAREAAIMDVPSIAISITNTAAKNFDFAGKVAQKICKLVVKKEEDLPKGTLLNVNIPDVPIEEIKGFLLTKQGKSKWDDLYEERKDPQGRNYYWLKGDLVEVDRELDTDQAAVRNKYVSVTPIHFDLTDYVTYEKMKNWKIEKLLYETNL